LTEENENEQHDNEILNKWLPIFVVVALLIVFYKTIDNIDVISAFIGRFMNIISPFLFAILISYLLYQPCQKLENVYTKAKDIKLKFIPQGFKSFFAERARFFSVVSIYFTFILIITVLAIFITPILIVSLTDLANNTQNYYSRILTWINNLPIEQLSEFDVKTQLNNFVRDILPVLFDPAKIQHIISVIIGIANGFLRALVSLIISLYILLERERIISFFSKLFKEKIFQERIFVWSEKMFEKLKDLFRIEKITNKQSKKNIKTAREYLKQIDDVIFSFTIGKSIDSLINFVVVTTILLLLNVKYAILLGFIAGIANFIPYLGTLIAVSLISLLTILTGGFNLAIKTLICLYVFQVLDANFIEPRIMRTKLKISPILVIFSVIFGGAYFGILGMFLAVPIAAILKQMLSEYVEPSIKPEESKPAELDYNPANSK